MRRCPERQGREMQKPGATPQDKGKRCKEALKARNAITVTRHSAPSELNVHFVDRLPGALPQAFTFRALGALRRK